MVETSRRFVEPERRTPGARSRPPRPSSSSPTATTPRPWSRSRPAPEWRCRRSTSTTATSAACSRRPSTWRPSATTSPSPCSNGPGWRRRGPSPTLGRSSSCGWVTAAASSPGSDRSCRSSVTPPWSTPRWPSSGPPTKPRPRPPSGCSPSSSTPWMPCGCRSTRPPTSSAPFRPRHVPRARRPRLDHRAVGAFRRRHAHPRPPHQRSAAPNLTTSRRMVRHLRSRTRRRSSRLIWSIRPRRSSKSSQTVR